VLNSDGDFAFSLTIGTDGSLSLNDLNFNEILHTAAGLLPLDAFIRFDLVLSIGPSESEGQVQARMSYGDSTEAFWSIDTGPTFSLSGVPLDAFRVGLSSPSGSTVMPDFWVDDIGMAADATDFLPPVTIPLGWLG
jgi:hypothetical protein